MNAATLPKIDDVETYRVVALSTAHLTKNDCDNLQVAADDPDNWRVMSREPGFFIKLSWSDNDARTALGCGLSNELVTILDWARESGAKMIEFDEGAYRGLKSSRTKSYAKAICSGPMAASTV